MRTLALIAFTVALLACAISNAEVPAELYSFSATIGNCSATIVKPFEKDGKKTWIAITAGHCVRNGESKTIKLVWPEDVVLSTTAKVVYDDSKADVASLIFTSDVESIPFCEIGAATLGGTAHVIGYPAGIGLGGKELRITSRRASDSLIGSADIWYGNSGGGLFQEGKLVGVASARDGRGTSYYADSVAVSKAYHVAVSAAGGGDD